MTDDETVVETAASAAEGYILSTFSSSDIHDLDIRVRFEDGDLTVDILLETAESASEDEATVQKVADDAVLVAQSAVDELLVE